MSSLPKTLTHTDETVFYPESDGKPMGETDWHIWALILLREGLVDFFADQADVFIGSDMFLYYVEGDPSKNTAPDSMVVKGVARAKEFRRTFKTWAEKAVPSAVFEIASEDTWRYDLGDKLLVYERLKVAEYYVFDPEALYVKPPLRGFRLRGGKYQPLKPAADGSLTSKELGLGLVAKEHLLRLIDARTGQPIPTRQERAELAEQRANEAKQLADQEKQRADQEKQRADQEKQRADAVEAELTRLRNERNKLRGKKK
jgi:Uma2 family endonuclease